MTSRRRLLAGWLLTGIVAAGCARPYSGPKTLGGIGAFLLVGGSTAWVAGERSDRGSLIAPGFVATVVGMTAVIAAGGWMATRVACQADPDCPEGEECREIPSPPGGIPYKQCTGRN
jgi:hypothetical protein